MADAKINERCLDGWDLGMLGLEEAKSRWLVRYRRSDGTEYERIEYRAPVY